MGQHFIVIGDNTINIDEISRIRPTLDYDLEPEGDEEIGVPFLEIWMKGQGLKSIRHRCRSRDEQAALHTRLMDHMQQHAVVVDLTAPTHCLE